MRIFFSFIFLTFLFNNSIQQNSQPDRNEVLAVNANESEKRVANKTNDDEISDSELDPQDLADYESMLKTIKSTSKEQLNNSSKSEEKIENSDQDYSDANPATEESSRTQLDETSSSTEKTLNSNDETTTLTTPIEKINSDSEKVIAKPNLIIVDIESVRISIEKSDDGSSSSDFVFFSIKSMMPDYQVKMVISTKNPLDFSKCPIAFNSSTADISCIKSYLQILEPDFTFRINRAHLAQNIDIDLSLVISGCDSHSRIRDIDLKKISGGYIQLPLIYHNSNHDCIYRVQRIPSISMLSLKTTHFPTKYEKMCKAIVQVYNSDKQLEDGLVGDLQASFEDAESIEMFKKQGLFIANKYVMIKVVNCYENNEPIEIKLDLIKKNTHISKLGDTDKYYYRLDSSLFASPKLDNALYFEMINHDYRNTITAKLSQYTFKAMTKQECEKKDSSSSVITIYGIDQYDKMFLKQYTSCSYDQKLIDSFEFKGQKSVYIQFYRDELNAQSNPKVDEFVVDFNLKIVQKHYQIFTKNADSFDSKSLVNLDLRNHYLDFEINVPLGSRILFNLQSFDNARTTKDSHDKCADYVIVRLNKTVSTTDSLYVPNTNPRFCSLLHRPKSFITYSNRLLVSFFFEQVQYDDGQAGKPSFNFSYTSEQICNNVYTKFNNSLISYSSIKSVSQLDEQTNECLNEITLNVFRRIVLYKIDWLLNKNIFYDDEKVGFINGKLACHESDQLIISQENPKYSQQVDSQVDHVSNTFCMNNPFSSFISKMSQIFLSFRRQNAKEANLKRPLGLEIGYFSYRYLYTALDSSMNIDFSQIIPQNVDANLKLDYLEFKIKMPNADSYIMPVIKDCVTNVNTGTVNIRSNKKLTPFQMQCGNETYTLMTSMEEELTFEFKNVYLSELRDRSIRFRVDYAVMPRVLKSLVGQFESNNYSHHYISLMREAIEYEWTIELGSNYFIKLNIDELLNEDKLFELSIFDAVLNLQLYDFSEIVENFKSTKKLKYLFSTNKIRIVFKHLKDSKTKLTAYPYIKCSYEAVSRILNIAQNKLPGELMLADVLTKNKLEWIIMGPKDHSVVVKMRNSSSTRGGNGQLKFSLLSQGYSDSGKYYYNLQDEIQEAEKTLVEKLERNTDLIISKDNLMKIEYLSGGKHDSFRLEYSFSQRVYTHPCGSITQIYNNFTRPEIRLPKLTLQNWVVKAPYGKRVVLLTKFIDLLFDEPCTMAKVDFFESNGSLIQSKCGHQDNELNLATNGQATFLTSDSNEVKVTFSTQNANEVVYTAHNGKILLYRGFSFYYYFLETPGDCYFQMRQNIFCGYSNVGYSDWILNEDKAGLARQVSESAESSFDKLFCLNCFIQATLPLQSEELQRHPESNTAIFISPLISRESKFLKFRYKLVNSGLLTVKLVYARELTKKLEHSVVLKTFSQRNEWTTARVKIGNQLFHKYRIAFVLEKFENTDDMQESSTEPQCSIDSIQLFDRDLDCASSMDASVCDADDIIRNINIEKYFEFDNIMKVDNKFCQKYATPCDSSKCLNGGICLNKDEEKDKVTSINYILGEDNQEDFKCVCSHGYTGEFCETRINPCLSRESNKCSNNSRCIQATSSNDDPMNYTCSCDINFHGQFCEQSYSPCRQMKNPCNQETEQGTCINLASEADLQAHVCQCSPMYTGKSCEIKMNEKCSDMPCNKFGDVNATCYELRDDSYACKCSLGFAGAACSNVDDCLDLPCQNDGLCIDGINKFTCDCSQTKFEGKFCEFGRDCFECNSNGTLHCDQTKSACVCKRTHGGKHCEIELDPCLTRPCVHGECSSNRMDEYKCVCAVGFKGKNCDLDETECDKGYCQNDGFCSMLPKTNEMKCECTAGFHGERCEFIKNLCDSSDKVCLNGGTCVNLVNNYTCLCPESYSGANCDKLIDNCLHAKCAFNAKCKSIGSTYICLCPKDKYGRYCDEEVDKCFNNECKNGYCYANELDSVDNIQQQYRCNCLPGYIGRFCDQDRDECDSEPCQNGGECIDLLDAYKCKCKQNYTGINCQDPVNYCSNLETRCDPMNTVRCYTIPGGNKCECQPQFTGARCDIPIDFCSFYKPCRSGVCVSNLTDYQCLNCTQGFGNKNCSEIIDFCEKNNNPCQNGGTCHPKLNGYTCQCTERFSGDLCQAKTSYECLYNNCKHNSKCVPTDNGYKCECDPLHEGMYCQHKKDKCNGLPPCQYGYCVDGVCECDPKILFCKKNSKCASGQLKCLNGGTCADVIEGDNSTLKSVCLCPSGLTGEFCEKSIFCQNKLLRPCGDEHQCVAVNQSYECKCDKPYIGHGCNMKFGDFLPKFQVYLDTERLTNKKVNCQFGKSIQSQYFIGITCAVVVLFALIALFLGMRAIKSYKKRYIVQQKFLNGTISGSSIGSQDDQAKSQPFTSRNFEQKTPLIKSNKVDTEISLGLNAFSIPRPSIRPPVRL
jgi:hypothetical protein